MSSQYSKIIDSIVDNQRKIETLINKISESDATNEYDLIKYAHFAQVLIILSDNVDSISQELARLQNTLAFIRVSTMHHSLLSSLEIRNLVDRLTTLYGNSKLVDLDIREYYDVIQLGSYYLGNEIVIVFKFPIFTPHTYDLYQLSIVPNKNHEILIPSSRFLAIHEKDFKYIEAECPKTSNWFLCEEKRSSQNRPSQDCLHQPITTQRRKSICSPVTVTLEQPAYEELDDRHYTINFPVSTKVHLSCGRDLYKEYHGSYLAIIPQTCYLETSEFIISNAKDRLKGHVLTITDLPKEPDYNISKATIKLNSINWTIFTPPIRRSPSFQQSILNKIMPRYITLQSHYM